MTIARHASEVPSTANPIRGHPRLAPNVTIKPSQRGRYDAENPDRPRRMGEEVRDTHTAPEKR